MKSFEISLELPKWDTKWANAEFNSEAEERFILWEGRGMSLCSSAHTFQTGGGRSRFRGLRGGAPGGAGTGVHVTCHRTMRMQRLCTWLTAAILSVWTSAQAWSSWGVDVHAAIFCKELWFEVPGVRPLIAPCKHVELDQTQRERKG